MVYKYSTDVKYHKILLIIIPIWFDLKYPGIIFHDDY